MQIHQLSPPLARITPAMPKTRIAHCFHISRSIRKDLPPRSVTRSFLTRTIRSSRRGSATPGRRERISGRAAGSRLWTSAIEGKKGRAAAGACSSRASRASEHSARGDAPAAPDIWDHVMLRPEKAWSSAMLSCRCLRNCCTASPCDMVPVRRCFSCQPAQNPSFGFNGCFSSLKLHATTSA